MSLIDFLKEEKEERKQRRKLQKEKKKKYKTPEQKRYRIYGFITVLLIIFGVFFTTCNTSDNDYTWNKIIGITDEMIIELEKEVDESKIMPEGMIADAEWIECNTILVGAGIDLEKEDNDFVIYNNFTLTDRQTGALIKKLWTILSNNVVKNICDLEIYAVGEKFYMRSVVYLDLSQLILGADLPSVYLTTVSHVEVLDNYLTCMSNDVIINNLSTDVSNEIINVLKDNSTTNIKNLAGEIIGTNLKVFLELIGMNMELRHGQIDFRV